MSLSPFYLKSLVGLALYGFWFWFVPVFMSTEKFTYLGNVVIAHGILVMFSSLITVTLGTFYLILWIWES